MALDIDVNDGHGLSKKACFELLVIKEGQGNGVFAIESHLTNKTGISFLKVGMLCRLQSLPAYRITSA